MFHTTSIGPHLPVVIPGRPQEYISVPTAGSWGSKGLGLNGVVSRGRNLRPFHELNVELGCFCVLAIENSAAVKSTSVFFHHHFLRVYAH